MSELKAIETVYGGHRFRSRLEARWAVYFDAVGLAWQYELEGYDLGEEGFYLPDFWLPTLEIFAEVKAAPFTVQEVNRCRVLAKQSGKAVAMLIGSPYAIVYRTEEPNGLCDERGIFPSGSQAEQIAEAINRATKARFEHGETPSQDRVEARGRYGEPPTPASELARELDAQIVEIDRRLPLLDSGAEKDALIEQKVELTKQLAATGFNYRSKRRPRR